MIDVLFFASLRERLGIGHERIDLPADIVTAADLIDHLRSRGGHWQETLVPGETLLVAVNQEMARPETSVHDGDEVAFFPPVTGG